MEDSEYRYDRSDAELASFFRGLLVRKGWRIVENRARDGAFGSQPRVLPAEGGGRGLRVVDFGSGKANLARLDGLAGSSGFPRP